MVWTADPGLVMTCRLESDWQGPGVDSAVLIAAAPWLWHRLTVGPGRHDLWEAGGHGVVDAQSLRD